MMRKAKSLIIRSSFRSNSSIAVIPIRPCPGLQPGRRIARKQVRLRVLCVYHLVIKTRAINLPRFVSSLFQIGRVPCREGCACSVTRLSKDRPQIVAECGATQGAKFV